MWAMAGGGQAGQIYVAFNTAEHATLVDNVNLGLPVGATLAPLFAIDGQAPPLQVGGDGRVSFNLPAKAGFVWRASAVQPLAAAGTASLRIDPATAVRTGDW
jgi:hypothetical protein